MRTHILLLLALMIFAGCLGEQCPDISDPVCGSDGKTYKNPCLAKQAGASVDYNGSCVVSDCSDPDGGKDIFTTSSVLYDGMTYTDTCKDKSDVQEYLCENGVVTSETYPCPAGYECSTGKCIPTPCKDSDGGIETGTKGTVISAGQSQTDACAANGSLKEYFCESGKLQYRYMDCPSGQRCEAGACVSFACSDSDGGKDESIKGTTKDDEGSYTDKCQDKGTLTEYYCATTEIKSEKISCRSGYECTDGACAEIVCKDSDGGKDRYTKGTTEYGEKSFTDSCYSSSQVLEYFCASKTVISSERISCGTGHECRLGICERIECQEDVDAFDHDELFHEIEEFDDGDKLRLYVGNVVEINDGMLLRLQSVSGNQSSLRLFEDYGDYLQNDPICTETIAEGQTETDLCGENTDDVAVDTVNDADDYIELYLEEYYAVEYFSQRGDNTTYTGDASCPEDSVLFEEFDAYFYPYLDTKSSGLNLDGRRIVFLDELADIEDIDTDEITIDLDNKLYTFQDGDSFKYKDQDYDIDLTFNDGGLHRIRVRED